jgi:hypothetical protein
MKVNLIVIFTVLNSSLLLNCLAPHAGSSPDTAHERILTSYEAHEQLILNQMNSSS